MLLCLPNRGPNNEAVFLMHYFLPGKWLQADKQHATISAMNDDGDSMCWAEIIAQVKEMCLIGFLQEAPLSQEATKKEKRSGFGRSMLMGRGRGNWE